MPYICFVISPIGEEGTATRIDADDLFDLVIKTALQKYDFQVIRADKINTVGSITSEIIKFIQDADLCIVDITGRNANVMYECGRRHETARPTIMMAKKGEELPFDINVMRTIFYELDTPRNVHNAITALQTFVEKIIKDGFSPNSSGDSLSSVIEVLNRIERKIDNVSLQKDTVSPILLPGLEDDPVYTRKLSAQEAFTLALKKSNISYAESLLSLIQGIVSDDNFYEYYVEPLCGRGSKVAAEMLKKRLPVLASLSSHERRQDMIGALVSYFSQRDEEQIGYDLLAPYMDDITKNTSFDAKFRAFILNAKERLLFGIGEKNFPECIKILEEAISLNPSNTAYYYNAAITSVQMKDFTKAQKYINSCMQLDKQNDKENDDHIELAIVIAKQLGNVQEMKELLGKLKEINPYKYELILEKLR